MASTLYLERLLCLNKVVLGMDVVSQIENVKTGIRDKPVVDVVIEDCGELHSLPK